MLNTMRSRIWKYLAGVAIISACAAQVNPKLYRLPTDAPPEILEWIWLEREFQPQGYKDLLDRAAQQTTFGLLKGFLCTPGREIGFPETHDQIKKAVAYAHSLGIR